VDPTAVPEVLVVPAVGNEALGVDELSRIAVPRSEQENQVRTVGDRRARDVDVGDRAAVRKTT
jgi:hypothetical protein